MIISRQELDRFYNLSFNGMLFELLRKLYGVLTWRVFYLSVCIKMMQKITQIIAFIANKQRLLIFLRIFTSRTFRVLWSPELNSWPLQELHSILVFSPCESGAKPKKPGRFCTISCVKVFHRALYLTIFKKNRILLYTVFAATVGRQTQRNWITAFFPLSFDPESKISRYFLQRLFDFFLLKNFKHHEMSQRVTMTSRKWLFLIG